MSKYNFYYDESEHSRKVSYQTVSAFNYYDNFATMIIGWSAEKDDILQRYASFEARYADRKDRNGEIKSMMLQQKQLKYGFVSLNKQNAQFINDLLSFFDEEIHIRFSVSSEIECLMLQVFQGYENSSLFGADLMEYPIAKAPVIYHPREIIKCLYESPKNFLEEPKKFLRNRIEFNKNDLELRQAETMAFQEILPALDEVSDAPEPDWDYHMFFDGVHKYLQEKNSQNYSSIIDREDKVEEESKTLKSIREIGLDNSDEASFMEHLGLRMADMMAGIIFRLLKGLCDSLRYQSPDESTSKKILDIGWFCLSKVQLELYKKLYRFICEWQPAWYKLYSGIYSDNLAIFNALLNSMSHPESVERIRAGIDMQGEYFNVLACEQLAKYFKRRRCKLPIELVIPFDEESHSNPRGGKVYFDSVNQLLLPLHEDSQTFDVLSAGADQKFTPVITIPKDEEPECFRPPNELSEWVCSVVGTAARRMNLFSTKVTFSNINGGYYVDIP